MKASNLVVLLAFVCTLALVVESTYCLASEEQTNNSTSVTKKLFTYSGPLLPSDWSLVSILNDRVVIGFENGTARNSHMDDLDSKDRVFVQKLQNGTLYTTPLSSAKEKLAQWSSSVSSTVSKLGKSLKEQYESLVNKTKEQLTSTSTSTPLIN